MEKLQLKTLLESQRLKMLFSFEILFKDNWIQN